MPVRPVEFDDVARSLAPSLEGLPPSIIAIDGRDGDGKTTLGRFLAWYFNITLLETDLYLLGDNSLRRNTEEIRRVIDARLGRRRPIVVEGVGVLQLLEDVGCPPAFHIYIRNRRTHWVGAQEFEDYKSKYLDVHDKVRKHSEGDKASILEDIDFELTLIQRDEINVAYILNLLVSLNKLPPEEAKKRQKEIIDLVAGEIQLRSKRQLIEQFIEDNLPQLKSNEDVIGAFESYWSKHKQAAFKKLCEDESIVPEKFVKVLQTYEFQNRLPRDGEIVEALSFKPKILERKSILERVADKIQDFINTFVEGMGGV